MHDFLEMPFNEVMERTAKVMVQAVRDGKHDMVVKLMSILEKKPEILAKLVMWADERTGANLLHWCAFYGKEVHVALTQSFMMALCTCMGAYIGPILVFLFV